MTLMENWKPKKIRIEDHCYFCRTFISNFARHVIRNHSSEPDVQKILSEPVKSIERKKLLACLRKKGNYLVNSIRCDKPVKKSRIHCKYVPCPYCFGYYSTRFLWRHRKNCTMKPQAASNKNAQTVPTETDETLVTTVFPRMRLDTVTFVAKNDMLICEFGAKTLRTLKGKNHRVHVTSRKMRDLSKLLTEVKRLQPSVKNLQDSLQPKFFNAVIEATRILSGCDETSRSVPFMTNITASLRRCCEIAIKKTIPNVAVSKLKTFMSLLESQWRNDLSNQTNYLKPVNPRKSVRKLPWTTVQKELVVKYFEGHIANKKPPKKTECETLIETYPDVLRNKSWVKIKVFVQNVYTNKARMESNDVY